MTSFQADPQALTTAASAFAAQVEPTNELAGKAESLQGNSGTAGRYYAAEGSAYHAAMLTMTQQLLTPLATKCVWVSDTLQENATSYQNSDTTAASGLKSAGSGA